MVDFLARPRQQQANPPVHRDLLIREFNGIVDPVNELGVRNQADAQMQQEAEAAEEEEKVNPVQLQQQVAPQEIIPNPYRPAN